MIEGEAMKRFAAIFLSLACALGLAGCGNLSVGPGRPVSTYIGDYVTRVDMTHSVGGVTTQWVAENEEVDRLRTWASELEYEIFADEEGRSPVDEEEGERYNFVLTEGDYPGFTYIINGPDDCYLLIEGNWFSVLNPSDPPAGG